MFWKAPVASTLFSLANPGGLKGRSPRPPATTVSLSDFHQWADDNKIVRSVEISQEPGVGGGKGLIATRDLKPGEPALQVPITLTIRTSGEVEHNDWAGSMASKLCEMDDEAATEMIGASVEVPFGDGQFYTYKPFSWKPYLDFGVPSEGPYTTCDWTDDELSHLQNDTFVEESRATAVWKESQYQRFASQHSKEDFDRALSLVCSRCLEAGSKSRMMVPFLDNANHASSKDGGGSFVCGSGCIVLLVGDKGVAKGEAVTLNYGERSSDEYAIHYGFVPDACPGDTIYLQSLDSVVSWDECNSVTGHFDSVVRSTCKTLLNSYSTTLDEDRELLRSYEGGFDAFRVALDYRLSKKALLSRAVGK